jgi:AcrR family transcriptional regulator
MPATPRSNLRERKRLATSKAIQLSALRLVVERGIDNVTIEQIATAADVSPRTFFNYFPSKEAAIVGEGPSIPDTDAQQHFVTAGAGREADPGRTVLRDLGELIAVSADHFSIDDEALRLRQEVHRQNPQLSALLMIGRRQFENQLVDLVSRRLLADDGGWNRDDAALESRARLITLVAAGTLRHAWMCWADGASEFPLSDRIRASFAEFEALTAPAR